MALRGAGTCPSNSCATCKTSGPDTRTIPIAPLPGGVAMAAIVSMSGPRLASLRLDYLVDAQLLRDRQGSIRQPVQYQTGGKPGHHRRHDQRHELHDLCLHWIG